MTHAIQLGNRWLTLIAATAITPALRILVGPVSREAADTASAAMKDFLAGRDPVEVSPADFGKAQDIYTSALAPGVILDWEGVGDLDGNPLPVSPEAIAMLMQDGLVQTEFRSQVVAPYLIRVAEKNGFSPSAAVTTAKTGASTAPTASKRKGKTPVAITTTPAPS